MAVTTTSVSTNGEFQTAIDNCAPGSTGTTCEIEVTADMVITSTLNLLGKNLIIKSAKNDGSNAELDGQGTTQLVSIGINSSGASTVSITVATGSVIRVPFSVRVYPVTLPTTGTLRTAFHLNEPMMQKAYADMNESEVHQVFMNFSRRLLAEFRLSPGTIYTENTFTLAELLERWRVAAAFLHVALGGAEGTCCDHGGMITKMCTT